MRRRVLGSALRIGVVAVAASLVGIPLVFFIAPMSADADAVTLCLPGIGPVQQYAEGLSGELAEVVRVHELMHVQQCRTLGAGSWYLTYGTREGRMRLEAEAFCAEVDFLARRDGTDREALIEPRARMLHDGYDNRGERSLEEVRQVMREECGGASEGLE